MSTPQTQTTAGFCQLYLESLAKFKHLPSIFTLKLGRVWRPQALPANVERGPMKRCYENAGLLAMDRADLAYVEGYACPSGLIPVQHAWCVTAQGAVIDNTFGDPESTDYFGVPFSTSLLRKLVFEQHYWGILAGRITPELLVAGLEDVQASPWPAPESTVAEIQALLDRLGQDK